MINNRFSAIYSEMLSTVDDPRFIMVDMETGEIVDDADGRGFKTMQKAYAAWNFKMCKEYPPEILRAGEWLERNKDVVEDFNALNARRQIGLSDGVTKEYCEYILSNLEPEANFSPSNLKHAWEQKLFVKSKREKKIRDKKKVDKNFVRPK